MYKLLIVDDEKIILNGLADHIDWEHLGYEVVHRLEDGKDAIAYLKDQPVDAILSDIRMYEVSGIELARHVSEFYPRIKIVFLSSYKEFDYAREAIAYGVCDYILKPISIDEINKVFTKVREIMDNERKDTEKETKLPFSLFEGSNYQEILSCNNSLIAAIVRNDVEMVYEFHGKLFNHLNQLPYEFMFFIVSKMFDEVYLRFSQMNFTIPDGLKKEAVFLNLSSVEAKDLYSTTGELILQFCEFLLTKKEDTREGVVIRAKKYINDNLANDFSFEDVAKSVFLSSSYFSRLFKNVTGENIMDYVINCRMQKTIDLLQEGKYSIKEISETVGYNDTKYFHRSFKKYTGYTIKQYQKLLL